MRLRTLERPAPTFPSRGRAAAARWLLAALPLLAACTPRSAAPPNVVVIVIDTLRADRLGVFGNQRGLTPFLDALAARSVVFHRAYAAAPWTQPSVASLFTSRFQSQHGIVHASSKLADSEVALAEIMRARGYATAAFSANPLVAGSHGYGQGFDVLQALWMKPADGSRKTPQHHRAEDLNARADTWLAQLAAAHRKPVFLYMQYMEPHTPYAPPDAMLQRTLGDRARPDLEQVSTTMQFGNLAPPDADALRDITDVYDAEVASVDAGIRDLFAILDQRGLLDHALVVVTADHGEGLLDHGLLGHGGTLYEEVIHVPLLIVPPGGAARVDVEMPVSLLDVAPTILDVVGAPVPPTFEGRSLAHYLWRASHPRRAAPEVPAAPAPRPVFSEHVVPAETVGERIKPHERAVVLDGAKVILGVNGERESYDLARDPREQTPLDEAASERLAGALAAFTERFASTTHTTAPIDAELRDRLRALGYFH